MIWNFISLLILIIVFICISYLWLIALASVRTQPIELETSNLNKFAITIPAHNEENVIGQTIEQLKKQAYPDDQFDIFVVADFCDDHTVEQATACGVVTLERSAGERGGKGAALSWLFERIFSCGKEYDAIIVYDADTQVDLNFLRVMNARLNGEANIIQGRHVISNPRAGWFPALTWAMMTIDNRFNNQGRENLGFSAKHMGDSICFRSSVLKSSGWGEGLTEDFDLRLKLLLENIKIHYEPNAIGYGQAPKTITEAISQRLRWAKGVSDSGHRYRRLLLTKGIEDHDWSKIDAVLFTILPSYSTLSLISGTMLLTHLLFLPNLYFPLLAIWAGLTFFCFAYPFFGLFLEKAPVWAYPAILSGPFFILWRSYLRVRMILSVKKMLWVRTPHHGDV